MRRGICDPVAADGRELVELCRLHRPNLVFSDERMPELNGSEAARLIMEFHPVPIVIISAFARVQPSEGTGAVPVVNLVKPVRIADILQALTDVQAWLERKSDNDALLKVPGTWDR
ncbi:MAG: response regulator [Planctomycetes bacterium]|nr:response regulator [Planctomycetota bacterium]